MAEHSGNLFGLGGVSSVEDSCMAAGSATASCSVVAHRIR